MSESGSWDSIRKHGLLSTSALLDLFEIDGDRRTTIESRLRMKSFEIQHPVHGTAVIRDQNAMWNKPATRDRPAVTLEECLDGISIEEWCFFLNQKVFFWPNQYRLGNMLGSYFYRNRPHWVIIVETREIVSKLLDEIILSAINTGSIWLGEKRNKNSVRPLAEFHSNKLVELGVEHSVPDIERITLAVEEWQGKRKLKTIWNPL